MIYVYELLKGSDGMNQVKVDKLPFSKQKTVQQQPV